MQLSNERVPKVTEEAEPAHPSAMLNRVAPWYEAEGVEDERGDGALRGVGAVIRSLCLEAWIAATVGRRLGTDR